MSIVKDPFSDYGYSDFYNRCKQIAIDFGCEQDQSGDLVLPSNSEKKVTFLDAEHISYKKSNIEDDEFHSLKNYATDKKISILYLDLSGNKRITDKGLEYLANFTTLESLNLSFCAISDIGLKSIANLKNLKSLNLTGCRNITADGIASLNQVNKSLVIKCEEVEEPNEDSEQDEDSERGSTSSLFSYTKDDDLDSFAHFIDRQDRDFRSCDMVDVDLD